MTSASYEDLYDVERRPGAGVGLWTKTVERQLERVRDANYRHRVNNSPNASERRVDPDAEWQLHSDVYFLALAIRRVLLFHDLFAEQTEDPRLADIRRCFAQHAPTARGLRNFLEHLDEYLLDRPNKRQKFTGRAAPVLLSRWDADNVVVRFGPDRLDVTLAAVAAIELGRATDQIWHEHLERALAVQRSQAPPEADSGVPRRLELTFGRSTVIGSDDDPPEIITGTLLEVRVVELSEHELGDDSVTEPDSA